MLESGKISKSKFFERVRENFCPQKVSRLSPLFLILLSLYSKKRSGYSFFMSQPVQKTFPGKPTPLGATYGEKYTQFSLFSRHATKVFLLLFDKPEDVHPSLEIALDSKIHKTGDLWHIALFGVKPGQLYGYRVDGPYDPKTGHRFNPYKLLIDPYARALTAEVDWDLSRARGYNGNSPKKDLSISTNTNLDSTPKCIVLDGYYAWDNDVHPLTPLQDTVIYEAHVKGFTQHPNSNVASHGTYQGIVEKIPYLKELGITAIELLPLQEFDQHENLRHNPLTKEKLTNYWGYSTINFFSPKGRYSKKHFLGEQVLEFKNMVKALHRAGIEVILDVVFNHTAEGNEMGPTLSFRGLDNLIYYMLEDGRHYKNYSACGNVLNCNHPILRTFILDCLHYWVIEMHVDGFRFDLASILGRDSDGSVLANPPLLQRIAEDPVLRNTKIIAEAWDAAGLYQVGSFPGGRFAEWNGKFRDVVRMFWRGDPGKVRELATRFAGSSDLYQTSDRTPCHSINFITCHDGFTLRDLVSYNEKHNEANGENNQDGDDNNHSCNYGIEGDEPADAAISQIRNQQRKNLLTTLILSQGVPMILAGDEMGRTQNGNNNPWCQDNETSWIDWSSLEKDSDFFRFTQLLIRLRKDHTVFRRRTFFQGAVSGKEFADIRWLGQRGKDFSWSPHAKLLAFFLSGMPEDTGHVFPDSDFFVMMNAYSKTVHFKLPAWLSFLKWNLVIHSGQPSPLDIFEPGKEKTVNTEKRIPVQSRSLIVLQSSTRLALI